MQTVALIAPQGSYPGSIVSFPAADGGQYQVPVPPGIAPGQTFTTQIPSGTPGASGAIGKMPVQDTNSFVMTSGQGYGQGYNPGMAGQGYNPGPGYPSGPPHGHAAPGNPYARKLSKKAKKKGCC